MVMKIIGICAVIGVLVLAYMKKDALKKPTGKEKEEDFK